MIKQTWNINSEEKLRILNLHESATKNLYLINEQEQITPYNVNFDDNTFESGQYNFNTNYSKIVNDKVRELVNYIKGKNLKDFKITITPGESQVTNQPPFQEKGSLANKRGEVLRDYLNKVLPSLLGFTPEIIVSTPIIGQQTYDRTKDNKDDPKYKKEQFVKASVVLNTKTTPVPTKTETEYKITSADNESIYFPTQYSNYLGAFAHFPTRESTKITDAGNLNTGIQDVTLKIIKKDTVPFQVTDVYKIPFGWWNNRTAATTNYLYPEDLEYIKKNFKRLS